MNHANHSSEDTENGNYGHHDHSHEYDPNSKPPYVTFALLILMVLVGVALVVYFRLI